MYVYETISISYYKYVIDVSLMSLDISTVIAQV